MLSKVVIQIKYCVVNMVGKKFGDVKKKSAPLLYGEPAFHIYEKWAFI